LLELVAAESSAHPAVPWGVNEGGAQGIGKRGARYRSDGIVPGSLFAAHDTTSHLTGYRARGDPENLDLRPKRTYYGLFKLLAGKLAVYEVKEEL
jgi:hypothetical protein